MYGKYLKSTKKFHAHDEKNECNINDIVRLWKRVQLSKDKSWRLVEIVEKSEIR